MVCTGSERGSGLFDYCGVKESAAAADTIGDWQVFVEPPHCLSVSAVPSRLALPSTTTCLSLDGITSPDITFLLIPNCAEAK